MRRASARGRATCSAALAVGIFLPAACGDGVGRPLIAMDAASAGSLTNGGTSGSASRGEESGTAGALTAGAVATSTGGAPGLAGSDASARGGERSFGGDMGRFNGGRPAGDDTGRFGGRPLGGDGGWREGDGGWLGGAARPLGNAASGGFDLGFMPAGGSNAQSPVPASAYCDPVSTWPEEAEAAEQSFVDALNALRTVGTRCGSSDQEAVGELRMEPALRCAARLHSLDMATRQFSDRVNPDGEDPSARAAKAGYTGGIPEEFIARSDRGNDRSPALPVVQELVGRGGDCETLIDERFDAIGVGYHEGIWTIDLAGP